MSVCPLRNLEWRQHLRDSPRATDQLVYLLLIRCGPALNVYWLDVLLQHGPRTGIPGLLTIYDIDRFAREAEPVVEVVLKDLALEGYLQPEDLLTPPEELGWPMLAVTRRRRRCRVAAHAALVDVAHRYPDVFARARTWDLARRFSPSLN